jgi:hypothetical protein
MSDPDAKQCLASDVFGELYESMTLVSTWGTPPCAVVWDEATEYYTMARLCQSLPEAS